MKSMYAQLKDFLLKKNFSLLIIYGLIASIATLQEFNGGLKRFPTQRNDHDYTYYNNYLIFKQSFFHLKNGNDLYTPYLEEHWDLYKYSPTFALFFGVFAFLPDGLGLFLWNLLNALCLFVGIRMLPKLELQQRNMILLLCLVELFTTLQNSQSNALIAGLVVMAFALMEKEKFLWGCLLIALTVYIKLFGLFAFALCLLYPQRWKMSVYSIVALIIMALLPLSVVSGSQWVASYESWWHLLRSDYIPNSLSLAGVIKIWLGVTLNQNLILLAGIGLFLLPFSRVKLYSEYNFRLSILAMILLWMVVFNHKAESPTFVIAITGIGIWNFSSRLKQSWTTAWVRLALVLTSLSPTDLFPDFIQDNYFVPWSVKAIPCILIYFMVFYELTFNLKPLSK